MRLLATISDTKRLALLIDLESGETEDVPVRAEFLRHGQRGREKCYPFGITWTQTELFVSNNEQLLIFDKALEFRGIHDRSLQKNIHQLAYRSGRIWAASPWTDSVIGVPVHGGGHALEVFVENSTVIPYVERASAETNDTFHLNSVLWAEDSLYVAAHNKKSPSKYYRFNAETLALEDVIENVGSAMHGLALDGDEMFWISSGTSELRSSKGANIPLGTAGFPRGLIVSPSIFVVAISEFLARDDRWGGHSRLLVIDRNDQSIIDELFFEDTGSINDIRLLDGRDYAHGVEPFWLS